MLEKSSGSRRACPREFLPVMFTVSNFLRFVLGAAITAAGAVLLLSLSSSCPGGVPRLDQELGLPNGTEADPGADGVPRLDQELGLPNGTEADPGAEKLVMTAAATARKDDLAELLRSAAMEDNTVIMTFTNEAWTAPGSLLDLFLGSFHSGEKTEPLLKHLVIVAVDGKAFARCKRVHPFCFSLDVGGGMDLTKEQPFMSKDYLEMMWARNRFQTRVLELGFSFVFTDVDIVWFRNPLLRIPVGADIAISCDTFDGDDPYDLSKRTNGGFVSARANRRTLAFFRSWYDARKTYPRLNEQDVFEKVKRELSLRHGAAVHYVDTAHLGGFCEPKKDFRQLCTFHGNCLKGLRTKLNRLRGVMGEWKRFKNAHGKQ